MKKTIRKLAALGTAIATTGAAQAAALHPQHLQSTSALAGIAAPLVPVAAGEAGEGGGTIDEDLAYHVNFAEIAGKLMICVALYELGDTEAAKERVIRPGDEIYQSLKPKIAEMNVPGAEAEMTALADAIDKGAPVDEVRAKLDAAVAAIEASAAPEAARELALTIVQMVRDAGGDYARGVVDGKVVEADEYQDAWAYVQAARRLLAAAPDFMKQENAEAFDKISGYLDSLDPAWPDLAGKGKPGRDSSFIMGVAARIEIVSLRME